MEWFKFYGKDFLTDPKVHRLSPLHQLMFVYLLCHASDSDDGRVEYLTEWQLAINCGVMPTDDEAGQVAGFFDYLEKLGMISREGDAITVIKYKERQSRLLTGAERAKRYREKHRKSDDRNAARVTNVTLDKKRVEKNREENTTTSTNVDDAFSKFWNEYPKKELKRQAQDIWRRKKLDRHLPAILSFVEAAKQSDRWKRGFIKQPTTFLNAESWNDDLEAYNDRKPAPRQARSIV